MLSRGHIIGKIIDDLSLLIYQVELRNKLNHYDLTKICEDFFREVLNVVYDKNLINLNTERSNEPGIDLGDKTSSEKIAFQVTSTITSAKVKDTLNAITDEQLNEYDEFFILMVNRKQGSYSDNAICQNTPDRVIFDKNKNIVDLFDLTKEIAVLDINKLFTLNDIFMRDFTKVRIEFEPINENGEFPSSLYNRIEELPSKQPENAQKLLTFIGDDEFTLQNVKMLYQSLSNISRHSREFISIIAERGDKLSINIKTLANILHMSEQELDQEMLVLEEQGLTSIYENQENEFDRKTYHFYIHNEALKYLIEWSQESDCSIRTLISKMDFRILDE